MLLSLGLPLLGFSQNRYFTRTGSISFFSEEVIENIEAHNKQVSSFVDFSTGELVFSVPMKAFQFEKALMQEHFNENYIESDKYPKSTFKGSIENVKIINLQQDGTYKVKVRGQLTQHGVTKPVTTEGTWEVKGGKLAAKSVINIKPEDYAIEIPLLVRGHIAEIIQVKINILYEPYNHNTVKTCVVSLRFIFESLLVEPDVAFFFGVQIQKIKVFVQQFNYVFIFESGIFHALAVLAPV